jgi:hypothetical protein
MERVIEPVASGLGNTVAWLAETGVLFAVFVVIWSAVALGLVWSAGTVDEAWRTIGALPLVLQAIAWVLFLPVMLGLWIWESSWPLVVRLVLLIGIGGWNLLIFLPRTMRATS